MSLTITERLENLRAQLTQATTTVQNLQGQLTQAVATVHGLQGAISVLEEIARDEDATDASNASADDAATTA